MDSKKIGFLTMELWKLLSNEAKINIAQNLYQDKTMELSNMGGGFDTVTVGLFNEIKVGLNYEDFIFEDKRDPQTPLRFYHWAIIKNWNQQLIDNTKNIIVKNLLKLYYNVIVKKAEVTV